MRHDDWLTVRTDHIDVLTFYPFTRPTGKKRGYRKEPHLDLLTDWGQVMIHGKRALWSFLDALFPDDPLPRSPVNADLLEDGADVIQGLLKDPDAWPFLRLNVRDGEYHHPFGGMLSGTWVLAASPASSDIDLTPTLGMVAGAFEGGFIMPYTMNTKHRIVTVPAAIFPVPSPNGVGKSTVIVTESIEGSHYVFSLIPYANCNYRPERFVRIGDGRVTAIVEEVERRITVLQSLHDASICYEPLRPLSNQMRFTEVDDLEHRRFLSLVGAASFVSNLGLSGIN